MTANEPTPPPAAEPAARPCENCGEPLLGNTCYACGQPTKGLVRQFSSILGDFIDTVFNIDGRIIRTLPPLLFKPGFLSLEYFEGRRVRYVSPVRLFFFLTVLAFVFAQWSADFDKDGNGGVKFDIGQHNDFNKLKTEAEVIALRDKMVAGFEQGAREGKDVPGLAEGMREGAKAVREDASRRIAEIRAGKPPAASREEDEDFVIMGSQPWHPTKNPVRFAWLPDAVNAKFNDWVGRGKANIKKIQKEPRLLVDAVLGALPTTLCVLLPIFALLLKLAYLFKRRMYMEHLIVGLHSHAFLSLALMLVIGLAALADWLGTSWLAGWVNFGQGLVIAWMPIYLLIMQKRVYRQGWIMTLLKYCVLGMVYTVLLSLGAMFTVLAAMVML